ncbi:single stranded DNA-binding protein [Synechococcus phage BUCT-ZZ01]|nr:single stranded DNA-binding protein [Synechococcus phage BUCT-ZZ01]
MKLNFGKLLEAIEKTENKRQNNDDANKNLWAPAVDKAGNGSAVIRFLPDQDINEIPFVKLISHGFKNEETGRWYIENNLSTIGKEDPIDAINKKLWAAGDEDTARKQKRQTSYYANILVVKDPANPENEGQVKLFRFGKKILDKIIAAAKPEFEEEQEINVFDPVGGADFLLKIKQVAGYRNYDDSKFGSVKALANADEVLSKCFSLQKELLDPSKFKSYDELVSKYKWVMGEESPTQRTPESAASPAKSTKQAEAAMEQEVKSEPAQAKNETKSAPASSDTDDDFFKSLLED